MGSSENDSCSIDGCTIKRIREALIAQQDAYALADFFKVFGDPTRIKILHALSLGELCVCDIAALLEMTQSAVSHQLRVLRQTKLVKLRRSGRTVYYSLDDSHIGDIIDKGLSHIHE